MTPKRGYMGVAVKEMRLISERDVDFVETETIVMFEEKLFYFPVYWPRKKMAPELTSVMA